MATRFILFHANLNNYSTKEIEYIINCVKTKRVINPETRIKIYGSLIEEINIYKRNKTTTAFTCNLFKNLIFAFVDILNIRYDYMISIDIVSLLPEFTKSKCIKLAKENNWLKEHIPDRGAAWFPGNFYTPRIEFLKWCIEQASKDIDSGSSFTGEQK